MRLLLALALAMTLVSAVAREGVAQPDAPRLLQGNEAPADIVMVTSAIVLAMRDREPPEGDFAKVVFAPGVVEGIREPGFLYRGFVLMQTILSQHVRFGADKRKVHMAGAFHFLDNLGRRTVVAFTADYRTGERDVLVQRARLSPIYPARPNVRLLIVPAEKVTAADLEMFWNNTVAMAFAIANAVPLAKPGEVPKGKRDYYVFAFFLDRMATDAEVDLRVSDTREGIEGMAPNPFLIIHAGWRTMILRGTFELNGAEEVFFKLIYAPGDHLPEVAYQPVLAGVFSTKLRPPPAPAAKSAPPPPKAAEMDPVKRLHVIQDLRRRGLITDDEYKLKRQEILDSL